MHINLLCGKCLIFVYFIKIVLQNYRIFMVKIVITGPESTGKSTLALSLKSHFQAIFSAEFAREYLETKLTLQKLEKNIEAASSYDEIDFYQMFLGQKKNEKQAFEAAKATENFIISDTDALTYHIWHQEVFKNSADELINSIDFLKESSVFEEISSIYLLCSPEGIVWQPDPLRENPNDRERLFDMYEKTLVESQKTYFILRGGKEQRFEEAVKIINQFLNN
jgi:HTH-type transcriptional regulator, transcriptional repressor of NAD biosynthesis genes